MASYRVIDSAKHRTFGGKICFEGFLNSGIPKTTSPQEFNLPGNLSGGELSLDGEYVVDVGIYTTEELFYVSG